jgi:hypothetical protein
VGLETCILIPILAEEFMSEEFEYSTEYDGPAFDPYLNAIGKIALEWADFEFRLNVAIWELANVTRKAGTCMTSQFIGPGPRFRCIISLLNLHNAPPALVKEFNTFSHEAEGLGRQRNRYLHDPMAIDTKNNTIHRLEITADRTLKHEFIAVQIDEITKLTGRIRAAQDKFDQLFDRALAETPPWPRTQFEQSGGILRNRQ